MSDYMLLTLENKPLKRATLHRSLLPEGIVEIGEEAFRECYGIKTMAIRVLFFSILY